MASTTTTPHAGSGDGRLMRESIVKRLLRRPELGALGGVVAVWLFFAVVAGHRGFLTFKGVANYLEVSAELGILAVAVSLLMIGGEFDLSIGSMIGASGMMTAILSVEFGWNVWAAIGASLVLALIIGAINGILVNRTKLPSFIITLATLFIIRGVTIGITRWLTGVTQVRGLKDAVGYDSVAAVFASKIPIQVNLVEIPLSDRVFKLFGAAEFPVSIIWWVVIAFIAAWILRRTSPGNWIFGIGGDEDAARNVGVPVDRMKIILFMGTAAAAWFIATTQVLSAGSADVLRGEQREFFAIIAVVIGGTLLTGGYGSAIGAFLGALVVGMVQQGIIFSGADSDWFLAFLGGMLIIAVLVNNYIRKLASEVR